MMRISELLLLLVFAIAITSCGVRGERVESSTDSPSREQLADQLAPKPAMLPYGAEAEAFAFTGTELFFGTAVRGETLYQSGPVVMTFVSPGCPISAEEAIEYSLAAEDNAGVTFVIVHAHGEADDFEEWVEANDLFHQNVVHLDDSELELVTRFSIDEFPTSVLVDADGDVTRSLGGLGHEGLAAATHLVQS